MNKIYKVVWSKVKNCYVVVSEIAKNVITGAVKSAKVGSSVASGLAMGALMAFVITGNAMAAAGTIELGSIYPTEQVDEKYSASDKLIVEYSVYDQYNSKIVLESGGDTSIGSIYAKSKSDITVDSVGNTTIGSVNSSGYGGQININSGETTTTGGITISNSKGGGDTINVGGKNISIDAGTGYGVSVRGGYYGFSKETTANIGTVETENVDIKGSYGLISQYEHSDINVYGKELNIEATERGIYTGNNSDCYTPSAEVNVYSDHTKITMAEGKNALVAFSDSTLNIHGGLEVTAKDAILVRGQSTVNVNAAGEGVVKLDGNVNFNNQYGTGVHVGANNNVNINMTTADSYLNGKIYVSNSSIDYENGGKEQTYEDVSGMKLGMSNGATWNVTGDSFVNNLYGTDAKLTGKDVEVVVYNREDEAGVAVTNSKLDIAGVDLVIDTEKTAIYNQDITIKSDSDVTIKSQQQGISAYGDVVIEAANVTIESVDNGIQSVADANPNDVGNVTIKATEDVNIKATNEGYAVTNVSKNGGVIDIEGKNVTLVSENRTAVKVGHEVGQTGYNGTVNVTGETITIEGEAKAPEFDADGKLVSARKSAAVYAQGGETELNLTATEAITIKNTGSTEGSAIGAYEGGVVNITSIPVATYMEGQEQVDAGKVTIDGQVTVAVGSEVTVKGVDVTVNSVEDALDTWGGNIDIDAADSINIKSSEKDGVQANDATVTLDAANVDIQAKKWGINNIAENDSSVVINATDVVINGAEGAIRTLNNGNGEVTVNATGTTKVYGDIYAEGKGVVNVDFKGEKSEFVGNVFTEGEAKTNLAFNGATWYADGSEASNVTNLEVNDATVAIENAQAGSITVGTLTGASMFVDAGKDAVVGAVVVKEEKDDVRISVNTNGVNMSAADTKGYGSVVTNAAGQGIVDEINANNTYISGDVKFEADGEGGFNVVSTTLNGDVKVNGDLTADNLYTKDEINAYRDQVNQDLEDKFAAAQDQVADKFAEVEDKVALNDRVNQVQNTQIAQMQSKNNEQDRVLADHENRIDTLEGTVADHEDRIGDLESTVGSLNSAVDKEVADREAAVKAEADAREAADKVLQDNIDKEVADREAAVKAEADAREAADKVLQDNIDKEVADREAAVKAEADAREAADEVLQDNIDKEVANREAAVKDLNNRIDKVDAKIDKVGAMAAAMASLKTMGYDPEAPTEIAVGIGQYRNETGIAIGAFHYPNKNFMLNFSLSTAGDEVMGGIGATWKIGRKR